MPAVDPRQLPALTVLAAGSSGPGAEKVAEAIGTVGVAVIANGSTSEAIQFDAALDGSFVQLTWAEDPIAATKLWYTWDGSGELTIHTNADPTADVDVCYHIMTIKA